MNDLTQISAGADGPAAITAETLPESVYQELRRLAAARLAHEPAGHTLQPTALVHEAWLKLARDPNRRWQNRAHFFATAAEELRRVLVDHARRKRAVRHGGGQHRTELRENLWVRPGVDEDELLAVHEALDALAAHDPRKAELVKLRYFMGMTIEEAGAVLDISEPTVKRDWAYARAWLFRAVRKTESRA
jgi:RNA polymerase sigma factor (TIGR02999 family)